jgi:hypothetical protein
MRSTSTISRHLPADPVFTSKTSTCSLRTVVRGSVNSFSRYLARKAVDMNCTRVEWSVLDWNQPAIDFYRSIGALPMDGWTVQRLDGERLAGFAKEFK